MPLFLWHLAENELGHLILRPRKKAARVAVKIHIRTKIIGKVYGGFTQLDWLTPPKLLSHSPFSKERGEKIE